MTRAFVAVVPPAARARRDRGRDGRHSNCPALRRTTRAQWHLTLQFLGDVVDLDAVADALAALSSPRAWAARSSRSAAARSRRCGAAQVLWVGAAEGGEFLSTLAGAVAARLRAARVRSRGSPVPPAPHARPHESCHRSAVNRGAARRGDFGPSWTVEEVVFYESRLLRTGAEYVPRAVIRLRI